MATQPRKIKKTKEEREAEYLAAVEQVFSYPLMPWQRDALLEIRRSTIEGRDIDAHRYKLLREGL